MNSGRSIHKFGGAVLKDASGIQKVISIIGTLAPQHPVIVVSALGKTTNALEEVWKAWLQGSNETSTLLEGAWNWHVQLIADLGIQGTPPLMLGLYEKAQKIIQEEAPEPYQAYDALVGLGEKWSAALIAHLLQEKASLAGTGTHAGRWKLEHISSEDLICTDNYFREARVQWQRSRKQIKEGIPDGVMVLTEGFTALSTDGHPTTLGREGSDYSGAILAWCLDAAEVHIWKDVPGVLNADPRYFKEAVLLPEISYREAIEMAFYGASIIHPRTIQPLLDKNIPLYARPLADPASWGTKIGPEPMNTEQGSPSGYILKPDQILLSFQARDFGFITESHLVHIFDALSSCRFRVNMMQNSAVSFSIAADNKGNLNKLLKLLESDYIVQYNTDLELLTVRHYRPQDLTMAKSRGRILLEQRNRSVVQWIIRK